MFIRLEEYGISECVTYCSSLINPPALGPERDRSNARFPLRQALLTEAHTQEVSLLIGPEILKTGPNSSNSGNMGLTSGPINSESDLEFCTSTLPNRTGNQMACYHGGLQHLFWWLIWYQSRMEEWFDARCIY